MTDKDWINCYEELARKYTDPIAKSGYMVNGEPISEIIFEKWFDSIQQNLQVKSSDYLLDVGCGSGLFLKLFSNHTNNLYGIDTSLGQLEAAKAVCPASILEKSDALSCNFENIKFDKIFCNSVFLYMSSLAVAKKVVEHFLDISSANAKIWIGDISYPTENGMDQQTFRRKTASNNLEMQHYPVSFFDELAKELKIKGAKIEQKVIEKPTSIYRYDYLFEKN